MNEKQPIKRNEKNQIFLIAMFFRLGCTKNYTQRINEDAKTVIIFVAKLNVLIRRFVITRFMKVIASQYNQNQLTIYTNYSSSSLFDIYNLSANTKWNHSSKTVETFHGFKSSKIYSIFSDWIACSMQCDLWICGASHNFLVNRIMIYYWIKYIHTFYY